MLWDCSFLQNYHTGFSFVRFVAADRPEMFADNLFPFLEENGSDSQKDTVHDSFALIIWKEILVFVVAFVKAAFPLVDRDKGIEQRSMAFVAES
jgi:hypothetical protein